jgi:hypothetical protein
VAVQDAIAEAANEIQTEIEKIDEKIKKEKEKKPLEKKKEEPPSEETEETEEETQEIPDEEEEETLSETELEAQELEEARVLYKALKDPKQRGAVIAAMAHEAGILNKPAETKTEEKVQKKAVKDLIKEALGPDLAFLSDKLGAAIEAVVNQQKEEQNAEKAEAQAQQVANEVVSSENRLNRETNGDFKRFKDKMNTLANEVLPGPTMTPYKYMTILYELASGKKVQGIKNGSDPDRTKRNANDSASRLSSKTHSVQVPQGKVPDKKMSLNESVAFALKEIEKK